jgi:hypothetical protein
MIGVVPWIFLDCKNNQDGSIDRSIARTTEEALKRNSKAIVPIYAYPSYIGLISGCHWCIQAQSLSNKKRNEGNERMDENYVFRTCLCHTPTTQQDFSHREINKEECALPYSG